MNLFPDPVLYAGSSAEAPDAKTDSGHISISCAAISMTAINLLPGCTYLFSRCIFMQSPPLYRFGQLLQTGSFFLSSRHNNRKDPCHDADGKHRNPRSQKDAV